MADSALSERIAELEAALREIASWSDKGHGEWRDDPATYVEVLLTRLRNHASTAQKALER